MSLNNRFQGGVNKENTARLLTHDVQTPTYAASLAVVTKKARTFYRVALTGVLSLTIGVDSGVAGNNDAPFDGDEIDFHFSADAGGARVVTYSTGFATSATQSVAASKFGSSKFRYNAAAALWIEVSRAVTV